MKIHESGAYIMIHAQVSLKNQQVVAFRESLRLDGIRIVVQEYDARVIEVITYTFDQALVHVNRPDQLIGPREIQCHPCDDDQT